MKRRDLANDPKCLMGFMCGMRFAAQMLMPGKDPELMGHLLSMGSTIYFKELDTEIYASEAAEMEADKVLAELGNHINKLSPQA